MKDAQRAIDRDGRVEPPRASAAPATTPVVARHACSAVFFVRSAFTTPTPSRRHTPPAKTAMFMRRHINATPPRHANVVAAPTRQRTTPRNAMSLPLLRIGTRSMRAMKLRQFVEKRMQVREAPVVLRHIYNSKTPVMSTSSSACPVRRFAKCRLNTLTNRERKTHARRIQQRACHACRRNVHHSW